MANPTSLEELQEAIRQYDSTTAIQNISPSKKKKIENTFPYNDGRSRQAMLSIYKSMTRIYSSSKLSFISLMEDSTREGTGENENVPSKWGLKYNCFLLANCKTFHSKTDGYILDLHGKVVESYFQRRLKDDDLPIIFVFLKQHKHISALNLCYNEISSEGFERLAEFLAVHKKVVHLNVMFNNITSIDTKTFMGFVQRWRLSCLRLTGNKIGAQGGNAFALLLLKDKSLKHLNMGETDVTLAAIIPLVDNLIKRHGNKTLTKLDLSGALTRGETDHFCRFLRCLVEANHTIVELVLSKNNICDHDLEIFVDGLENSVLSRLNFSCNRISSIGAVLIANALPRTEIKMLILASNMIGDDGATALGRVFAATKLTYLDLSRNEIGDLGMTNLVLGICRPVDGMLIFGNKFTDVALQIIHSQVNESLLPYKSLDIRFWWDEKGELHYTPRNLYGYSHWYYNAHYDSKHKLTQHCCCPVRGNIIEALQSEN